MRNDGRAWLHVFDLGRLKNMKSSNILNMLLTGGSTVWQLTGTQKFDMTHCNPWGDVCRNNIDPTMRNPTVCDHFDASGLSWKRHLLAFSFEPDYSDVVDDALFFLLYCRQSCRKLPRLLQCPHTCWKLQESCHKSPYRRRRSPAVKACRILSMRVFCDCIKFIIWVNRSSGSC